MRLVLVLAALALLAPAARARRPARPLCTFRTAKACAGRELATQAAIVPAVLRTVVGMVPPDSTARAAAGPSTIASGCYTITTDASAGTFALTLAGCPGGEAGTIDGSVTGTADVQSVGSITGESGCAPILSAAPLGTTCPVAAQVTMRASVDAVRTDDAGHRAGVTCSGEPAGLLNALLTVDLVVTKVASGTPGATCFAIPGFCATFTAEPTTVALTALCTSRAASGGRTARRPVGVALRGLIFAVVPSPEAVGCALGGDLAITPPGRAGITGAFDGDCVPSLAATRRRRRVELPAPARLF